MFFNSISLKVEYLKIKLNLMNFIILLLIQNFNLSSELVLFHTFWLSLYCQHHKHIGLIDQFHRFDEHIHSWFNGIFTSIFDKIVELSVVNLF